MLRVLLRTVVALALVGEGWAAGVVPAVAQEPAAENFTRYRARVIERLALKEPGGRRVHSHVAKIFGISADVRLIKAAQVALRDQHLTLGFSTNSSDILLTETKRLPDGTSVLMVFYTDLALTLRGAASGPDTNNLHVVAADDDTTAAFSELLSTWNQYLPQMLESPGLK